VSKDAADSADEMSRAADEARDLRDAYKQLKGELDQDQAWLNLEDKMRQFRWDMASGKLSIDEKRAALVDVKSELLNYLSSLEGVPAEKQTEVLALIDQGKLDEAEALLENLSRARFVAINPVTGGQMVNVTTGINGRRALGGDVAPGGTYLVGENGPEYLKMGATGGTVIPNHALAGTTNYFITNQIKADPNGTVQSLKQYERINGTRWRR
jgi:soluble cytochrome b562